MTVDVTELDADREIPVPIEPDGPYGGVLPPVARRIPRGVRGPLAEAGGMAELLVKVLVSAIRHPRGYWGDVIEELAFTIRRSWVSISLALFGFMLALSVPSMQFVQLAGVGELYGPLLLVQSCRTFTVWVATLLVAGVIGAAMTAELGSRKVREELDAMTVMGIDPVRTLVLPRVVSVTLATTLISVPAIVIQVMSAAFASWYIGGLKFHDFMAYVFQTMSIVELFAVVLNSLLAGLLIGAVCAYKGLAASGGAIGLGRAVNQAVVISFLALFVMQLGYNAVVLGFFPGLGAFK